MGPKNCLMLVLLIVNLGGLYVLGSEVTVDLTEDIRVFNLKSPKYPENAGPGTNISWAVNAPDGNRLSLLCTDIYLPKSVACWRGVLSITASDLKSSRVIICSQTSSYILESNGNKMTVQFKTGASSQGRVNCVVAFFPKDEYTTSASLIRQTSCPCGRKNLFRLAEDEKNWSIEFPFLAYIQKKDYIKKKAYIDSSHCVGSILTQRHILTLASCLYFYKKQQLMVVVDTPGGKIDPIKKLYVGAQTLSIKKMNHHEKFNIDDYSNNIGLLFLSEDIQFNYRVRPVCLPTERYNLQNVRAVGWGQGFRTVPFLDLPVVSDLKECHRSLDTSTTPYLCTRYDTKGDQDLHGTPLVYKDPELKNYVLVGLVAGYHPNPDIYHFYEWIQEKIGNDPQCPTCEKLEQRPLS